MCGHVLDSRSSCKSGESFITFSLLTDYLLVTLRTYAQQGYAFCHVHLYIHVCMSTKNRLFSTLSPAKCNLLLAL